jgi:hypothetical protein
LAADLNNAVSVVNASKSDLPQTLEYCDRTIGTTSRNKPRLLIFRVISPSVQAARHQSVVTSHQSLLTFKVALVLKLLPPGNGLLTQIAGRSCSTPLTLITDY